MVTTSVAHSLTPMQIWMVLAERSTNIRHLTTDPVRVLFTSLLWLVASIGGPMYQRFAFSWHRQSVGWGHCAGWQLA
jgi:hypothetical protein